MAGRAKYGYLLDDVDVRRASKTLLEDIEIIKAALRKMEEEMRK